MVKPMRPDTDAIRDWIKRGMSTGPVDTIELCDEIDRQATVITGLVADNKDLIAAIKKECDDRDEMYDKADELGAEVATWIGAYEEATKWKAHYSDRAIAWVQTCRRLSADNKALQERGTAIQEVNVKFKRQINELTEQNKQLFREMANYKQERDTARADLYLAEQRECVLEEQNKLMREALEEIWNGGYFNPDRLSLAELTAYKIIAQDALIATGEPK